MKKAVTMFIKNLRYLCLVGVIALGLMTIVGTGGGGGGASSNGGGDDDNPGTLQLGSTTYSATEGTDPTVTITVTRTGGSSGAVSVSYATSDGTATEPSDYSSTSGTLNWADGDTVAKTFTVAIVDDSSTESTETFNVTLSNVSGATLGTPSSATVSITDDDNPGTLQLGSTTYSATEGTDPTVTITVTRTGGSSGAVSVSYATSDGTATEPSDYSSTSGTLNWADGDTVAKTFTVAIVDDSSTESTETFNVTLSNVSGATLGTPSSATVSITDDDNPGTLQLGSTTYSATEGTDPTVTITVTRTGGSSGAVSVSYATSDGTATEPSDYSSTSGTLNWADGDTVAKTFTVAIVDDSSTESTETFNVTLSNVSGATLGTPSSATVSITDTVFTQAELAGKYHTHYLAIGYDNNNFSDTNIWAHGIQEFDTDGNVLRRKLKNYNTSFTWYGREVDSLGPAKLTLDPSGMITSIEDLLLKGTMGVDGNTVAMVTSSKDDEIVLRLLTRTSQGFVPADLTGSWLVHDFSPDGLQWKRGALVVAANGIASATFEFSNVADFILPESGAALINDEGGVTLLLSEDNISLSMSADREIMVGSYTGGEVPHSEHLMVAVRFDEAGYTATDLTGHWSFNATGKGGDLWWNAFRTGGHGTFDVAPDGTTEVLFQSWRDTVVELPKGLYTMPLWRKPAAALPAGRLSFNEFGVVNHESLTSFTGTMSRDRNVMVATYLTPDNAPVLFFAQRRRSAPSATVTTDDSKAVSAYIDGAGGTVGTTAADGTTYRLDIPASALDYFGIFETIGLAPISTTSGEMPAGEMLGGVQLTPEGLRFLERVSLTITPTLAPPAELLGFSSDGRAADRFDFLHATTDGTSVNLTLQHFTDVAIVISHCMNQIYPNACFAMELKNANLAAEFPATDKDVAEIAKAWLEQSILPDLENVDNIELLYRPLYALLKFWEISQMIGLDPVCDWLDPDLANRLANALPDAVLGMLDILEAACQLVQTNCDRGELLQQVMRLQLLVQTFPDTGCLNMPGLDEATLNAFCDGALLKLPMTIDVTPKQTGVVAGDTVELLARVRSATGIDLAGWPVVWKPTEGSTGLADVDGTGRVTGKAPGSALIRAEVQHWDACVNDVSLVLVAPAMEGVWKVTTTDRRSVGRPECQTADITTPPAPYNVEIRIGNPDPDQPGAMNATWCNVGCTSGIMSGSLTGPSLKVGARLPGAPEIDRDCTIFFIQPVYGEGICKWQRWDLDSCWGEDDIVLQFEGFPAP